MLDREEVLVQMSLERGTFWNISGGGAEKLCLLDQPEYLPNTANIAQAIPSSPHVHGAEYEYSAGPNSNTFQHNVPCAICYASVRSSTIMIPAKIECPPGSTMATSHQSVKTITSHPSAVLM